MNPQIAGLDTEYGISVEARGASSQVEDATEFVRSFPGRAFVGWDYRFESPRQDLRGFQLDRLAVDPLDAEFDEGKSYMPAADLRADRVLENGSRFYNDHGHPEFATPECARLDSLVAADLYGERVLLETASAYSAQTGLAVSIYKNNTDFHGASYGSHENYLVDRKLGFQTLFQAVSPMLIARTILCGAGKVGAEAHGSAVYQLSQRADFFVEAANAETLYRRPIFNTRDEPHAPAERFGRLHVISGDANMIPATTARKVGLVKIALGLAEVGEAPKWDFADPVRTMRAISRDETYEFRVELSGRNWTTAYVILESYFAAAERFLELDEELLAVIEDSRTLMVELRNDFDQFARRVDWAAKRKMLEQIQEMEGLSWGDRALQSYDLEYHSIDPEAGLYHALTEMGQVDGDFPQPTEPDRTRGWVRGHAIAKFKSDIETLGWRAIRFRTAQDVELRPDMLFPAELADADDVGTFISRLREAQ